MANDNSSILNHIYGIAGLVPGLIGLAYLVKTDAPWQEYALLASGWIAAFFYGVMLWHSFGQTRADGERVGVMSERINSLERELSNRNALLDYLAGLLQGRTARPRANPTSTQDSDGEHE